MEFFLRVIADTEDTVLKEVRIKGAASMMNLHEHIFSAFGLNPGEMASFYYSTANWDQGGELPMFAMDDDMPSMEGTSVEQFFSSTKNGLYVYNFLDMNIFYLEVVKTEEEEGLTRRATRGGQGPNDRADRARLRAQPTLRCVCAGRGL